MSMIRSVSLVGYTEMSPPVPAGTIAALAMIVPGISFKVDTSGRGSPVGQTVM